MIYSYLDLETGEVISVSDQERGLLVSIHETCYDEQFDGNDLFEPMMDQTG
jgi:hypothetical protein